MTWTDLSLELRNIYLQEFSSFAKWIVFLTLLILSSIYVFYIWKRHTPTNYFSVAIRRIFFFCLSWATLVSTPFLLIGLSPEYSFWEFYQLPLTIYSIILSLVLIGFAVDIIRFGIPVFFKFGGLDFKDPKVREVYDAFKNNKHLVKW